MCDLSIAAGLPVSIHWYHTGDQMFDMLPRRRSRLVQRSEPLQQRNANCLSVGWLMLMSHVSMTPD